MNFILKSIILISMKFVNRVKELELLKRYLEKGLVVVYGRRRVGKTALIRKVIENQKSIYYQAVKIPKELLYKELSVMVGKSIGDDILSSGEIKDPAMIFKLFSKNGKGYTLVLDEFGYMVEVDPSLPSIIQREIDERRGRFGLILTGSTYSIIQKLLGEKSPLWGRVELSLEVKPIDFAYTQDYWEKLDFHYRASLYGALGGMPYNWERVVLKKDFFETLYYTFFKPESPLFQEVFYILREELRETKNYMAILHAISSGRRKFNEIADLSSINPSSIMKYLEVLKEMKIVKQEIPVGFEERRKRGLWRVEDSMVRFWFRFVFPSRHLIEIDAGKGAMNRLKREWDNYMGGVYEDISIQIVYDLIRKGELGEIEKIGRWWGKTRNGENIEIDILGLNEREVVLAGEVKWGYFTESDYKNFLKKLELIPFKKSKDMKIILFSGKGFKFKVPHHVLAIEKDRFILKTGN